MALQNNPGQDLLLEPIVDYPEKLQGGAGLKQT
jgi:hypothetical protein